MQMHIFVLMILINGQVVSDDMYFRDIHRCNFFVDAIVSGMRKSNTHEPNRTNIEGYCVPQLVQDINQQTDIMVY